MSDYDNTNRGVLFKNDRRERDTQPNAKGSINVDGTEYWLSAWTKTDKNGNRYQSLSVTPKEQAHNAGVAEAKAAAAPADDFDDDVPF